MQLAARRQAVRPAKSCGANLPTADVRATAASRADCNGPLTAIAALVADDGLTMSLEIASFTLSTRKSARAAVDRRAENPKRTGGVRRR